MERIRRWLICCPQQVGDEDMKKKSRLGISGDSVCVACYVKKYAEIQEQKHIRDMYKIYVLYTNMTIDQLRWKPVGMGKTGMFNLNLGHFTAQTFTVQVVVKHFQLNSNFLPNGLEPPLMSRFGRFSSPFQV